MKQYEEMREKAKREHGNRDPEILRETEVYPDCFILIYRVKYESPNMDTMICVRFLLQTPEGFTGGICTTEF